jgi:hypothetical protein
VPEGDPEKRRQSVADFFGKMELDPEVTGRTLGRRFTNLTPDVYLAAVKKLLAVHSGEADSDDRDSLAYQHFMGPEDLIAERVKSAGNALRPLFWRASPWKSRAGIPPGFLSKMITGAITNSGLAGLESVYRTMVYSKVLEFCRRRQRRRVRTVFHNREARTIAKMPALIAAGKDVQAFITETNSESSVVNAPDSAPPSSEIAFSLVFSSVVRIPPSPHHYWPA